jgi:hypothetical protein
VVLVVLEEADLLQEQTVQVVGQEITIVMLEDLAAVAEQVEVDT